MKTPLTHTAMVLGAVLFAFGCFVYAVFMQREAMAHRATLDALQGQLAVLEAALERIGERREKQASLSGAPPAPVPPAEAKVTPPVFRAPPQPPEDAERRVVDPAHLPPADPADFARMSRQVQLDAGLDREFNRLERREQASTDEVDLEHIRALKEQLLHISELFARLEEAVAPDARSQIQQELQVAMGEVIRLSRTDRNHRMAEYARSLGMSETAEIVHFIQSVEGIFRETDTDWSRLSQQGSQSPD